MKNTQKIERYFYEGVQNRHEDYWKTEQHVYHGIQNWHEHDWKTEQYFSTFTTEHKTEKNITKYKKMNGTAITEHKTGMSIAKLDKYKKTEHEGTQNRQEHY